MLKILLFNVIKIINVHVFMFLDHTQQGLEDTLVFMFKNAYERFSKDPIQCQGRQIQIWFQGA